MEDNSQTPPVEVPLEKLPPEILNNVIKEFILREGTDYGVHEVALDTKIEQIHKQLKRKEIRIVFDFQTESVTLMPEQQWKKLSQS